MDLKLKLILLVVSVVQHLDATAAPATTTTTSTAAAAATTKTAPAGTTTPTTTSGSGSVTTSKPAPKAPVECYTGHCTGPDACKNTTVSATYTLSTCKSGICVTKSQNSTLYEFFCASTNCADEKAKAKGWEVRCCEQDKCNKYTPTKENSSTRLRGDVIAICAWLVLFIVKLF